MQNNRPRQNLQRIPESRLSEIREYTSDIIGRYVRLKPSGSALVGLCPFHDEAIASFNVHRTKHVFHCFGCNARGDVFQFIQRIEHVGFREAIERAAALAGFHQLESTPVPVADVERRQRIRRGAERWLENALDDRIRELRARDRLIAFAEFIRRYCEAHHVREEVRDTAIFDILHHAYIGSRSYSLLEWELEQLNSNRPIADLLHRDIEP